MFDGKPDPATGLAHIAADTSFPLLDMTIGDCLRDKAARFGTRDALVWRQDGVLRRFLDLDDAYAIQRLCSVKIHAAQTNRHYPFPLGGTYRKAVDALALAFALGGRDGGGGGCPDFSLAQ